MELAVYMEVKISSFFPSIGSNENHYNGTGKWMLMMFNKSAFDLLSISFASRYNIQ